MALFGNTIRNIDRSTNINYPKNITVTEKRAPTDESIKLYDEYLEKTKQRVLSTFKIDTKYINAVVVAFCMESSMLHMPSIEYLVKFKINGNEEQIRFKLDGYEVNELQKNHPSVADEKLIRMIVEKLSDVISVRILSQVNLKELGAKQI